MAEFCIEIAGRTAAVRSLFDSTRDYCGRYLSEKTPDIFLTVCREELEQEQQRLRQEALEEGLRFRQFPDPFLERSVIQRKLAERLLDFDVLLFHGSTVAVDGEAYLFTAHCGTGKSTHTRLWRQVFGDRAVMVNDDKPFLRFTESGVLACGAPWSGKHGLDSNLSLPLKGICILRRGTENRIRPAAPPEALEMLRKQAQQSLNPANMPRCRELVCRLSSAVPLWQMECTRDPQAAWMAYGAMSGRK
nr:hypothetical protein [Oscillospiraceae bacterium]